VTQITPNAPARITTQVNPDGGTQITEKYADGQLKKVSGTAVPDTAYEYGTWSGGKYTKTIYLSGSGGTGEWVKTYTDMAGRVVREEKPTSTGQTASTYYTHDGAGRVIMMKDLDGVTTLTGYDANGEQAIQAIDMNGNNQIDLGEPIGSPKWHPALLTSAGWVSAKKQSRKCTLKITAMWPRRFRPSLK